MSSTAVTKITPEQGKVIVYVMGGILVVVLVILIASRAFGGLDAMLEALGLRKSKKEKENEADIATAVEEANALDSAWNPSMYKTAPAGSPLLTDDNKAKIAYRLFSSVGLVWDNESQGVAAIKQCATKAQISQIADYFYTEYHRDLIEWLENKYDTYEQEKALKIIVDYVKALPKYK